MANDLFAWVDQGNPIQDPRVEDDPFERAALARARGITIRPRTIPLATGLGNAVTVGNKLMTDPAVRTDLVNKLTGSDGEERMTTWPERMGRGVMGLAKDVSSGDFGTVKPDDNGMVSDEAVGARRQRDAQEVQDLSNFVIGGSLPMAAARGLEKNVLGSGIVPKDVKAFEKIKPSRDMEWFPGHEVVEDKMLPVAGLNSRTIIEAEGIRRTQKIINKMNSDKGYWERPLVDEKGNVMEGQHRIDAAQQMGLEEVPVTVIRPKASGGTTLRTGFGDEKGGVPAVAPLSQQGKVAPVFYSGVENALEHSTQALATPEQWLGTLKNAKGVKPEEMQWLGVEDFLNKKKAADEKVSRAELQDYVNQHKVDVKEVKKEKSDPTGLDNQDLMDEAHAQAAAEMPQRHGEDLDAWTDRISNKADDIYQSYINDNTKYSDYQLPGGKDYGELLLTMPHRREQVGVNTEGDLAGVPFTQRYRGGQKSGEDYHSSHWDEPNVLAHVRYNTRDIDGKKTLHLEEIQSDWHQAGKKKGYQGKQEPTAEQIEQKASDYFNQTYKDETHWGKISEEEKNKWREEAHAALKDPRTGGGVPDAPFKKSWPELAFKRMIRHAAENGYDAVSWTPSEAQAARYDLSKHVDQLKWYKDGDGYRISGSKDGNIAVQQTGLSPEKLEATVGKDVAKQIIDNEEQHGVIKGDGLKVGGEGMKRFYDDQLVTIANKYAKAHGGKVEKKALSGNSLPVKAFHSRKEAEDYLRQSTPEIHYMELPAGLKDTALRKGFPLFSHGMMLTPVEGNPFEDKREPHK